MTVQPKFTQAQPVILDEAPVVLRFAGLFPQNLGKFKMHDERCGGDLDHVDQELSRLNQVLAGEPGWQQQIRGEIAEMRRHNHEEHSRALKAKSRMKDARKLEAEGPADPWRSCSRGPLREGIITVNKDWLGGAGLRKQRTARETAKMIRRRDMAEAEAVQKEKAADAANALKKKIVAEVGALEPRVKGYEARAEEAAEKYRAETAARKAEEEKRARVIQERQQAEQVLNATKAEKSDLAAQLRRMVQHRGQEEKAAAEARAARLAEEKRLQEAEEKVRLKATEAEVITDAIETGLDLVADGAVFWREASADQQAGLSWGGAAPDTKGARAETLREIRPAMRMVTRIAQLVARTVKRVLAKERQKLKQDADYVRALRQKWEPEDEARLSRITLGGIDSGPK